jgi:hypothetical protein
LGAGAFGIVGGVSAGVGAEVCIGVDRGAGGRVGAAVTAVGGCRPLGTVGGSSVGC